MATDATSVRLLNYKTTASRQREKSLPRGQDTGVTHSHLQRAGQMTAADDGATAFVNGKHTEKTFWASLSTVPPNGSSKVIDETTNVGKTDATSFGFTLAVSGEKDVLRSESQRLTSQVLPTHGETTALTQSSTHSAQGPSFYTFLKQQSCSLGDPWSELCSNVCSPCQRDYNKGSGWALCESLRDREGPHVSCLQHSS